MLARIFAGLLFAVCLISPALAAAPAEAARDTVLAPFHAFIDGFNKGDMKAAAAPYADDAVIIDEFPAFLWRGKAFAGWAADLAATWKAGGITGGHMALAAPTQFAAANGVAYAIIPAHLTFTEKGKPGSEDGVFAVTLKQMKPGWRITAWAWTTRH